MFLLDDGWFANKYPRKDDHAGLGDWEATKSKLPDGIPGLVRDAKKAGVKFGIWIEPEMVNPKSELFEKHPDWVIMQPKRDTYYYRNQLDPASKQSSVKFFLWNNMGLIASVICFLPIVILLLANKDLDGKTKKIVTVVAAIALVLASLFSIDFNPVSSLSWLMPAFFEMAPSHSFCTLRQSTL